MHNLQSQEETYDLMEVQKNVHHSSAAQGDSASAFHSWQIKSWLHKQTLAGIYAQIIMLYLTLTLLSLISDKNKYILIIPDSTITYEYGGGV